MQEAQAAQCRSSVIAPTMRRMIEPWSGSAAKTSRALRLITTTLLGFLSVASPSRTVWASRDTVLVTGHEVGQPPLVDREQPSLPFGPGLGRIASVRGDERVQHGVVVRVALVLAAVVVGTEGPSR